MSYGNRYLRLSEKVASLYSKLLSTQDEELEKLHPRDYSDLVDLNKSTSARLEYLSKELSREFEKCHKKSQ